MVLTGFLRIDQQFRLSKLALSEFVEDPYKTNLHAHEDNVRNVLWQDNLLNSVRWATMGYHYRWTERE